MSDKNAKQQEGGLWPKKNWWWMEQYQPCGCSSVAPRKKDLLGYCARHGGDRSVIYRIPKPKKETMDAAS